MAFVVAGQGNSMKFGSTPQPLHPRRFLQFDVKTWVPKKWQRVWVISQVIHQLVPLEMFTLRVTIPVCPQYKQTYLWPWMTSMPNFPSDPSPDLHMILYSLRNATDPARAFCFPIYVLPNAWTNRWDWTSRRAMGESSHLIHKTNSPGSVALSLSETLFQIGGFYSTNLKTTWESLNHPFYLLWTSLPNQFFFSKTYCFHVLQGDILWSHLYIYIYPYYHV